MIRQATAEDIPHIVAMARKFNEASDEPRIVEEDAAAFIGFHIDNPDSFVAVSARGFIIGVVGGAPWNQSARTAHEVFWWSEGRDGIALLNAFEQWAASMGCEVSEASHPSSEAAVGHLLERRGYRPQTNVYRKVLPCA